MLRGHVCRTCILSAFCLPLGVEAFVWKCFICKECHRVHMDGFGKLKVNRDCEAFMRLVREHNDNWMCNDCCETLAYRRERELHKV